MFNKTKKVNTFKRVSIRRFWTSRYLVTLFIGLAVSAVISAMWIRHTALENRLNTLVVIAQVVANRFDDTEEQRHIPNEKISKTFGKQRIVMDSDIKPDMYITDTEGIILSSNRTTGPFIQQLDPSIVENTETIRRLTISDEDYYVVKVPITIQGFSLGWVVMLESKQNLSQVDQEYTQLAIMIISLAFIGWGAIYYLTGRLSKPIKDVANAAKEVAEGNYQVELTDNSREQEVHELVHSFKEMTNKLEKLEHLRTELLAGVTHELKTPVTSISGLLQAIKDDVVTGTEAKDFINISLNETEKMKKMVEDLLSFNQFSANAVQVNMEHLDINDVVKDAVYIWQTTREDCNIPIFLSLLPAPVEINIDPIRFQQIMTNLLNNAMQAIQIGDEITIDLSTDDRQIIIDISDTGNGIPEEEQGYIFERFFRGEEKKYKVRGLGLGLSLSKMIAQALGGDLGLLKSSPEGTTFRIFLPIQDISKSE